MKKILLSTVILSLVVFLGFQIPTDVPDIKLPILPADIHYFGGRPQPHSEKIGEVTPVAMFDDKLETFEFISAPVGMLYSTQNNKIIHSILYKKNLNELRDYFHIFRNYSEGNNLFLTDLKRQSLRNVGFDYTGHNYYFVFNVKQNTFNFFDMKTSELINSIPSLTDIAGERGIKNIFVNSINENIILISYHLDKDNFQVWNFRTKKLILERKDCPVAFGISHTKDTLIVCDYFIDLKTEEYWEKDTSYEDNQRRYMKYYDDHIDLISYRKSRDPIDSFERNIIVIDKRGNFIKKIWPVFRFGDSTIFPHTRINNNLLVTEYHLAGDDTRCTKIHITDINTGAKLLTRCVNCDYEKKYPGVFISKDKMLWFDTEHAQRINIGNCMVEEEFEIFIQTKIVNTKEGALVCYPKAGLFECYYLDNNFKIDKNNPKTVSKIKELEPFEQPRLDELIPKNSTRFYSQALRFLKSENNSLFFVENYQLDFYSGHGGNKIVEYKPCPSFSIKRIANSDDGLINFEFENTRDDELADDFEGKVYLVAWGEEREEYDEEDSPLIPSVPAFVNLSDFEKDGTQIQQLDSSDKQIISFELPDINSIVPQMDLIGVTNDNVEELNHELKYFALIIESNGLLDTKKSQLSNFDSFERANFDGFPLSLKKQKSLVITIWGVNE